MLKSNAISGAGELLSEIQGHIDDAPGPTMAFTLIMQKQAIEDRIRFKQWLEHSRAFSAEVDEQNDRRAAASVRLSRRAQHTLNAF